MSERQVPHGDIAFIFFKSNTRDRKHTIKWRDIWSENRTFKIQGSQSRYKAMAISIPLTVEDVIEGDKIPDNGYRPVESFVYGIAVGYTGGSADSVILSMTQVDWETPLDQ